MSRHELSRGQRIHNRNEKARALRLGERPKSLIRPTPRVESHDINVKKEFNWPTIPSVDEAIKASMAIATFYGLPFSSINLRKPVKIEELTDGETEERLRDLAEKIMVGDIKSHEQIAMVVRSLGHKFDTISDGVTGLNRASFNVVFAVRQRQATFSDGEEHKLLF